MIECKVCQECFINDKSLHAHLKKHDLYQAEYYCKYYPRYSYFYKKQIPFKNKKDYFQTEFLDYDEFIKWERSENPEIVKSKCVSMLKERIEEKNYHYAPFHNELKTLDLPNIDVFKKHFGSYNSVCKLMDKEPIFNKTLPKNFNKIDLSGETMLVDTREQDPLEFKKTKIEKLFIGDYLIYYL